MEVLAGLVVFGLIMWWVIAHNRRRRRKAAPQPPAKLESAPPPRVGRVRDRVPASRAAAERERIPFAHPGGSGPLFCYGGVGDGVTLDGPYAVIDVETTGLSPGQGDRVIEVAVARVDSTGRIEDEYATLLNPQGRDVGATFIHRITNDAVRRAPGFGDVAGEILSRLSGAVVVAHNAVFEERFLAAEFARAGIRVSRMPALCTLWLGRRTFTTPNHRLRTLCQHAAVPAVDAHAALGDVRAVAGLLPTMLGRCGGPLTYQAAAPALPPLPTGVVAPMTRAVELRKGTDGWMASLMSRLPISASEVTNVEAEVYLSALSDALGDGKLLGDEATSLAKLAGQAGMGGAQVAALNERFLESMREAAFEDHVVTSSELRQLRDAAKLLGVPGYFDDLRSTASPALPTSVPDRINGTSPSRTGEDGSTPMGTARQRRCGNCRQTGHYRTTCPQLVG